MMKSIQLVRLLIVFIPIVESLSWLSLGLVSNRFDREKPGTSCKSLKGLTKRQIKFCKKNIDLMDSVRTGALAAHAECQFQFHKRRWNCTLIDPVTHEVIPDVFLHENTRESAFVHAVSAAAVAYKVTRDCAKGISERCGCDYSKNDNSGKGSFMYQGCSDNVKFGIGVSKEFVDSAQRKVFITKDENGTSLVDINQLSADGMHMINLHNNQAGRQVLEKSLRRECKCHGMSGSCEMRTCWDSLPNFREIGMVIKDKFDGAAEVKVEKEEGAAKPRIVMKHSQFKRHTNADLVYMTSSPDFCEADPMRGIMGTKGRQCTLAPNAIDDCSLLCCGRGYEKKVQIIEEKCYCKFIYCCEVRCESCQKQIEKYYCL
uniref:Protein Wnt n=2 Tax=Caenorhabditis tropicalis TaxID=1561998 RepID=A0A1I7TG19_9PELO